jgi:hypothetical protein
MPAGEGQRAAGVTVRAWGGVAPVRWEDEACFAANLSLLMILISFQLLLIVTSITKLTFFLKCLYYNLKLQTAPYSDSVVLTPLWY